jgi:hypothetical protein
MKNDPSESLITPSELQAILDKYPTEQPPVKVNKRRKALYAITIGNWLAYDGLSRQQAESALIRLPTMFLGVSMRESVIE